MTILDPRDPTIARAVLRHECLEEGWRRWLPEVLPDYCEKPLAWYHQQMWDWLDATYEDDTVPKMLIACIHRGGAKSTFAEEVWPYLSSKGLTNYALYVSDTKDQATDHIVSIRAIVEEDSCVELFPELSDPEQTRSGEQADWRKPRLSNAAGSTIEALGLATGFRGKKKGRHRADLIIVDDFDRPEDTPKRTQQKYDLLKKALFPSGRIGDTRIIVVQNLVKRDGVMDRLMKDRKRSALIIGPVPAVKDLSIDTNTDQIIGGTSSWKAYTLADWQRELDDSGLDAFMEEYQHEVGRTQTRLFYREWFRYGILPDDYDLVVIGVDPAKTPKESSDETGIVIVGMKDEIAYVIEDCSGHWGADDWASMVCTKADYYGAAVVVEDNAGGMYLESVLRSYDPNVRFYPVTASVSKYTRAFPVHGLYQYQSKHETDPRIVHTSGLEELETQMTNWNPDSTKSPDRLDALVYALMPLFEEVQEAVGVPLGG